MTPLDGALKIRDMGYKIFPVASNTKIPPKGLSWPGWAETATLDTIKQYQRDNPNTNWGISCASQLAVIDIDNKHGKDGTQALKDYQAKYGYLPKTLTVKTPSGGYHLYFEGQIKQGTNVLGEGIDIRSAGGYVLAPGSIIDGIAYTVLHDRPIASLPPWVKPNGEAKKPLADSSDIVEGTIEEGDRDTTLTRYGGLLRGVAGLTEPELKAALTGIDAARCTTTLGEKGIAKIANSMAKLATNEAKAIADFASTSTPADAEAMKAEKDWPTPLRDFKLGGAPRRKWLLPEWLPQGEISSLYGGGSTGKSLLTLQMGLSVASGGDFMGVNVEQAMPFIGVYCEDSYNEVWRRLDSIRAAPEYAFVGGSNFSVWPRVGKDNALTVATGAGDVVVGPFMPKLRAYLGSLAEGPKFLVLDTLSDIYMGDENTREKVNKVIKVHLAGLAAEFELTVLMLAHPSRTGQNTDDMLSGSTAWENAVRNRLVLKNPKDSKGGIVKSMVNLIRYKSNYAARDDVGIPMQWENGRFVHMAYSDEEQRKAGVLGEFLARWCKGETGACPIDDNLTLQLSTEPEYGQILDNIKSHPRQQAIIIKLLKQGVPNTKDLMFKYDLRETKIKHWVTWTTEIDILT